MSTQKIELNVEARNTGKHNSRALRRGMQVPAVIYGAISNKSIVLEEKAVVKYNVRAYENALFTIKSNDKELNNKVALIKEVVVHPLSRRPQHVDLFALDLNKTVRVFVEVKLEGKPVGLAEGGLLNIVNRQVEIECLPLEIPEFLKADISDLGVGDALHVSSVALPSKTMKFISAPETTIAVVNLLDEEAPAAAPVAAAATPAAGAKAPAAAAGAKAPAAPAKKK